MEEVANLLASIVPRELLAIGALIDANRPVGACIQEAFNPMQSTFAVRAGLKLNRAWWGPERDAQHSDARSNLRY